MYVGKFNSTQEPEPEQGVQQWEGWVYQPAVFCAPGKDRRLSKLAFGTLPWGVVQGPIGIQRSIEKDQWATQ